MLISRFKYRQLLAITLASFLLYSWVIKEAHHLFVPHEHHHCESQFTGQQHFYDADKHSDSCLFCLTTFFEFIQDDAETRTITLSSIISDLVLLQVEIGHKNHPSFHTQWRGPPLI
ncbi:MAG: hypothetical protein AAGG75_02540 [Bacteroidota bacterium]